MQIGTCKHGDSVVVTADKDMYQGEPECPLCHALWLLERYVEADDGMEDQLARDAKEALEKFKAQ